MGNTCSDTKEVKESPDLIFADADKHRQTQQSQNTLSKQNPGSKNPTNFSRPTNPDGTYMDNDPFRALDEFTSAVNPSGLHKHQRSKHNQDINPSGDEPLPPAKKTPKMNLYNPHALQALRSSRFTHSNPKGSFQSLPNLGPILYPDGSTYKGQFLKGFRSGVGEKIFKNGSGYKGTFEHDLMSGTGCFVLANGDLYQGQFVADEA